MVPIKLLSLVGARASARTYAWIQPVAFVGVVVVHVVGTSSAALHYVAPETRDAILVRACTLNANDNVDFNSRV